MNKFLYNGELVHTKNLISIYNGSFLYGINCFEGIRGYWDTSSNNLVLVDLDRHINRLFSSAQRLSFKIGFTKATILSKLKWMILNEKVKEDVYIRITFFIDGETSWIEQENISYIISCRSMRSNLKENLGKRDYKLYISNVLRISELSMPPSVKAGGNYLNSRYAKIEAIENEFDDALIINQQGFISESTGSCFFFLKGNNLYTPSLDSDILESITRHRIITLCKENGINVIEGYFRIEDTLECDAAFLCGTMIEIMPVSKIGEINISTMNSHIFLKIVKVFKKSLRYESI